MVKKWFRACVMCFSMFCAIPSPFRVWDDEARPLMTLFLPAVGAWIGILWTGLAYLTKLLGLPALIAGAILCAYPFLVTGGMHFDGFLDVTDAVKSWRDLDERRRILKDPNVGSFAVLASEYAGTYRQGVRRAHVVWFAVILVAAAALGFLLLGKAGFVTPAILCGYLWMLRRGFKSLDGMSGDISGYALTFGELCGIAVFALI